MDQVTIVVHWLKNEIGDCYAEDYYRARAEDLLATIRQYSTGRFTTGFLRAPPMGKGTPPQG